MSEKNENDLGLPDVDPDVGMDLNVNLNDALLPASYKHQMYAEAVRQKYAIDAVREKTKYAVSKIAELNQHAVIEFDQTAESNERVKRRAEGKVHYILTEQFTNYMTQVTAQQMAGVAKVGNAIIAQVVAQSPYPPPKPDEKPEEPKGFLSRLFNV